MLTKSGYIKGVPSGIGTPSGMTNPSKATLIRGRRGSLAFITHLGAWNPRDIGLYPRITCAACK